MATSGIAAGAYAQMARIGDSSGIAGALGKVMGNADGPSFTAALKDAIGSVAATGAQVGYPDAGGGGRQGQRARCGDSSC